MAMQCLSKGSQQLSMSLTNNGGLQGFLTIVYGENIHARRESLWEELHQIAIQIQDSPWLVAGDFNTARFTTEKVGGKTLKLGQLSSFNDCLSQCNLSDLRSMGGTWSWNNKRTGGRRIAGRLDKMSLQW